MRSGLASPSQWIEYGGLETIASNGSSTIDYTFGSSASGGTAGRLMVWNYYNRVLISSFVFDTGNFKYGIEAEFGAAPGIWEDVVGGPGT